MLTKLHRVTQRQRDMKSGYNCYSQQGQNRPSIAKNGCQWYPCWPIGMYGFVTVFPIVRFFGFLDLGRLETIDLEFRSICFPNGCFLIDSKHGILGNRLDPWKYIPIRKVIIWLQFSRVIITILTIYMTFRSRLQSPWPHSMAHNSWIMKVIHQIFISLII